MMDEKKNNSTDDLREISELFPEKKEDETMRAADGALDGNAVKTMGTEMAAKPGISVSRESEHRMGMKKKELIYLKEIFRQLAVSLIWNQPQTDTDTI